MKLESIKSNIFKDFFHTSLYIYAFNIAIVFIVLLDRYLYENLNFSVLLLVGNAPKIGQGKITVFLIVALLSLIGTVLLYKYCKDKKKYSGNLLILIILYMCLFSFITMLDYSSMSVEQEIAILPQSVNTLKTEDNDLKILLLNMQSEQKKLDQETDLNIFLSNIQSEQKKLNRKIDLLLIRQLVEKDEPRVKNSKSELELAIYLRDYVYSNIILKNTTPGFDFNDFLKSYKLSFNNPEHGHICGGLAIEYQMLLEAFGVQSRYVGLFSDNVYPYDSHATVEVYINGKWIASDPSFNVMFKKDGVYLGYSELRDILLKNGSYEVETNDMQIDPGRRIEEYYIPMKELMKYIVIYPSYTIQNGVEKQYDYVILPKEWDGKIIGVDGKSFDMLYFNDNNIQYVLSNGILR